nr:D,D-peptidase/D,D-carboxypeptidase VanY-N [Allokutzneria albata]
MTESRAIPDRPRDRLMRVGTRVLAVLMLPVAFVRAPGRARHLACQWALRLRYPTENLDGLDPRARKAFEAARTQAFWQDGQLIGLTSGHRDAAEQYRMFMEEVRRSGSWGAARRTVLPPEESSHVRGIAMDVRPTEGAYWLELHGGRYDLYRTYDNEWWHFEYRPETDGRPPVRMPHPGAAPYHSATC